FAHDPLDIGLRGSEARDARAHDRRVVTQANLRHPSDLTLVQAGEELAHDETVSRETHERKRRSVDDPPTGADQRMTQHVAPSSLMLDHRRISRFATLGKCKKQLQADEAARPLN